MGWQIDAGLLHLSDKGVALKPQLKVGYADNNVNVRMGIEDVRNGLSAAVAGQVHREYAAEGNGLQEVLQRLKNESDIQVLDDIISAAPKLVAQVMDSAHVHIANDSPVWAKMTVRGCIGATGAVCLGWANTDGFHMLGVQGAVSAAAGIGGDVMIGRHSWKPLIKYILGFPNLCMEIVQEYDAQLTEERGADLKHSTSVLTEQEAASRDALAMTL